MEEEEEEETGGQLKEEGGRKERRERRERKKALRKYWMKEIAKQRMTLLNTQGTSARVKSAMEVRARRRRRGFSIRVMKATTTMHGVEKDNQMRTPIHENGGFETESDEVAHQRYGDAEAGPSNEQNRNQREKKNLSAHELEDEETGLDDNQNDGQHLPGAGNIQTTVIHPSENGSTPQQAVMTPTPSQHFDWSRCVQSAGVIPWGWRPKLISRAPATPPLSLTGGGGGGREGQIMYDEHGESMRMLHTNDAVLENMRQNGCDDDDATRDAETGAEEDTQDMMEPTGIEDAYGQVPPNLAETYWNEVHVDSENKRSSIIMNEQQVMDMLMTLNNLSCGWVAVCCDGLENHIPLSVTIHCVRVEYVIFPRLCASAWEAVLSILRNKTLLKIFFARNEIAEEIAEPTFLVRDLAGKYGLPSNVSLAHLFGVAMRWQDPLRGSLPPNVPLVLTQETAQNEETQKFALEAAANAWAIGAIFQCMMRDGFVQIAKDQNI